MQESPPSVLGIFGKSACARRGDRGNLSYSFGVESTLPSAAIASETTWTKQASAFAFHHAQPGVQRGGFLLFVTSPAPAQSMGQNLLSGFIAFTTFLHESMRYLFSCAAFLLLTCALFQPLPSERRR